jgi:hypothetical protein
MSYSKIIDFRYNASFDTQQAAGDATQAILTISIIQPIDCARPRFLTDLLLSKRGADAQRHAEPVARTVDYRSISHWRNCATVGADM